MYVKLKGIILSWLIMFINHFLLQFWFCALLRWKDFVVKIQIVLQWSKIMIVCTTMAVQLLCVHSHWENSYETIVWDCQGKEELLCSGSKVGGSGLEDCLLVPRRHSEIFLFVTISGLTGGHVVYLEPFLWSEDHSWIPSVANTMNVWSFIWTLLCAVMWWSLVLSPHSYTNKGKPGACTVILPSAFWAADPHTINCHGEWLISRSLPL